jgi:large subunit ribosomal protein L7/L12
MGAWWEEEQTVHSVRLVDPGQRKINVIIALRGVRELSLGEAKALVDGAPCLVMEDLPLDQAKAVAERLRREGAQVELVPAA